MCGPNAVNEDPCAKKNKKGGVGKQGDKDNKSSSGDKDKGDKDNKGGNGDGKSGFVSASAVEKSNKTNKNKRDKDANAKKETNKKPTNKNKENSKQNEGKSKRLFRKNNSIRVSKDGKKLMKDRLPNRFDVRICDVMRVELEQRDLCRW